MDCSGSWCSQIIRSSGRVWHRVSEVPGGGEVKRPKIGNPNPPLEAAEKGVLTEENRVVEKTSV